MVWPPTTHQDVQDEIGTNRGFFADYLRTGYYTTGVFSTGTVTTNTLTANFAYVRPFWMNTTRAFDRIGINVATAATAASGGTVACAVYQPGAGVPGPLVLQTTTLSSETTGAKEFTIATTLTPGVWWVGVRAGTAGCGVTGIATSLVPWASLSTTPISAGGGTYSQSGAGTAFADPWAGAVSQGLLPLVSLRAA